jgi:acetyl esterase/lipase
MYMTPADTLEQTHATKMIVNCLMPFEAVSQWADTTVGRRGPEYEQWKERLASRVLGRLQLLYPGFRQCVDRLYTASPLTIRDYYGQPEGALYGVQKDCQNLMLSQLPVWTKVGNLLLTGQNVNLHGICGVPLTAINTVEAIVGRNRLVEKIGRMLVLLALWLGLATGMQALNLKEFLPAGGGTQPSTAVIVCPGGSYFWLAGGTEGDSVARSLTEHGLAAYVLRYRTAGFMAFMTRYRYLVPGNSHPKPLDDVQEAILLLRRRGYSRVGVMGFSAGGHLALSAAIFGRDSLRPDFIAPCYPVVTLSAPCVHKRSRRGLLGEWRKRSPLMRDSLSLERHVHSQMPPVFLMNCKDDPIVDYRNSELMDSALTAQGVPHRYIQYATGGHGFGTTWRKTSREAANWLREFLEWLGVISKS